MPNTLSRGTRPPGPPPKVPDAGKPVEATPVASGSPVPANLVPVQTPAASASDAAATSQAIPAQAAAHLMARKQPPLATPVAQGEDDGSMHAVPTAMHVIQSGANVPKPTTRAEMVQPLLPTDGDRPKIWLATHKAPADPDPRLILLREPDSMRAACFRVMRHRLAERGNPRVIAVSSAEAGDGKTTLAANLALALSEFGRAKVLLLEANMRAPQLAVMFGFLPPECFSVQLQRHRERPLEPWSIVEAFSPSLHVLAVKPGESNRPLLDAPAFAIALEMLLRIGYDYVVVDTPPVLGSADVNLVEDYVDAVVLASRAGTTRGRSLRAAVEQISPRKLIGVALLDA